jgi:ClpP class serine protease
MNVSKKKECKFVSFLVPCRNFTNHGMNVASSQYLPLLPPTQRVSNFNSWQVQADHYTHKKVTKEDLAKSKEDIEDVLKLFKTFVKENRPSLDIDKVATGETWFGTDALALNLCDEIQTVDDVVTEYVDKGYTVFDVKYEPPEQQLGLERLLPVGGTNANNVVSRAVRWLARTVASEFTSQVHDLQTSWQRPDQQYVMKDDTSNQIEWIEKRTR